MSSPLLAYSAFAPQSAAVPHHSTAAGWTLTLEAEDEAPAMLADAMDAVLSLAPVHDAGVRVQRCSVVPAPANAVVLTFARD
jgi:hypothetical protein